MPKPSADCSRERLAEHHREDARAGATANDDDHDEAADQVEADLERRELLGGAADRLDAADDHQPGQHGDDDAGDPRGTPTCVFMTSAIEFGCVNGVVVNAAMPATTA